MNLTNLAVSALVANSVSQNVTGAGLVQFFTDKKGGGSSFVVTLPELIDGLRGGTGGVYGPSAAAYGIDQTPQAVMFRNLKKNAVPLAISVIAIPAIAKVATKVLRKPMILPANRMLKASGLDVKLG
jgi:hypothetical protein